MRADKFLQDIHYVVNDFVNTCNQIHKKKTLFKLPVNISKEIKITTDSRGFTLSLDYCGISIKSVYSLDENGIELIKTLENGNNN